MIQNPRGTASPPRKRRPARAAAAAAPDDAALLERICGIWERSRTQAARSDMRRFYRADPELLAAESQHALRAEFAVTQIQHAPRDFLRDLRTPTSTVLDERPAGCSTDAR